MRHTSTIFGTVVGAMILAASPVSGQIQPVQAGQAAGQAMTSLAGPKVPLKCVTGSVTTLGVKVGITTEVTNNLAAPIPAGTLLRLHFVQVDWNAALQVASNPRPTDVEGRLTSAMLPGQSFVWDLPGRPDLSAGCQVWFLGGRPDLELVQFTRTGNMAKLVIRNNNAFTDAGPFVARFSAMKCSQIELAKVDLNVHDVLKGQTRTVQTAVSLPPGFQYFDAWVDATNTVKESDENNNRFTGVSACVN